MSPLNLFWLFASPVKGWNHLVHSNPTIHGLYMLHVIPFSVIPPLMLYLAGSHNSGWFLPAVSGPKLILIAATFFVVELVVVPVMGMIVRQLTEVAETHSSYREAFTLAAVAPTPLWLAPIFLLISSVTLNLVVVCIAMMLAARLIYAGIPVVFGLKERGHAVLLFGAVLIAGVVAWGFLMVSTLVVWGSIQNLQFTLPMA